MKPFKSNLINIYTPLVVLTVGYIAVGLYLNGVLKFNFMRSDALWYWNDSLNWRTPFNPFHVPGYSLTIALLRGVSFGKVPPVPLMMAINFAALLACSVAVYKSIKIGGADDRYAFIGASLFGLWPFIGLVEAVYPRADVPTMALLLTGLLALQHSRRRAAALFLGLCLVFHKGMWIFVALMVIADIFRNRRRTLQDLVAFLILIIPIFTLWLFGALHHGSPTWIASSSLSVGIDSRSAMPVLEGMTSTIAQGGLKALVKGGFMVILVLVTVAILLLTNIKKPAYHAYGIAMCSACLFLFVFLTQIEIWAAVRFSRLLVVPLMWIASRVYRDRTPAWSSVPALAVLFAVLLSTQFAFSWYMTRVFFE